MISGGFYVSGIDLTRAEAKLTTWLAADDAVASGKSYTIGDRSLTRANEREIRNNIKSWDMQVKRLTRGGGIQVRGVTPSDH